MIMTIFIFAASAVLSPLFGGEISKALYDSVPCRTATYSPECGRPDLGTTLNYARDEPSTAHDKDALAVLQEGCTAESYAKASYGAGWDMQVRRAIYERALDFAEPVNQTALMARMDFRNLPCLPPDTPRGRFSVWSAVYGTRYEKGQPVIWTGRMAWHADAIGALIDRYSHVRNVHASIPGPSLEACARNDGESRSYALFPIGVVIHRGQDAAEELAHFHNFAYPHDTSPCTTFGTPGGNYVTTWDEFAAAYRGLKIDAWRQKIDLGKSGSAREYAATMLTVDALVELSSRVPANSFKLLLVYGEALSDEGTSRDNDDRVKIRSWMDSDSVGRKIL